MEIVFNTLKGTSKVSETDNNEVTCAVNLI